MSAKRAKKSVPPDAAATAAIAALSALALAPSDALSPPSELRQLICPGLHLQGNHKEMEAARIDLVETEDEDQSSESGDKAHTEKHKERDDDAASDLIQLPKGKYIHISMYLGDEWQEAIVALDNVTPVDIVGLRFTPHAWQKKGAAQGHWLCEQPKFKIFFCGDEMGLGKTNLAVMMIKLAQPQRGFCLVVAPKTVGQQWADECNGAFEKQEALRVVRVTDSRMTAHQLFAQKPDVVIVSYELVENIHRSYLKAKGRATSFLHTEFWQRQDYPIKRLFLDEAHRTNNTKSKRYHSLRTIPAQATVMLSGTFPHNKWNGWAGPVSFIKHQPIKDIGSFNRLFGSWDYNGRLEPEPAMARLRLLQRFLMRFTVARPAAVLELPGVEHWKSTFELNKDDANLSENHYLSYIQAQQSEQAKSEKKAKGKKGKRKRAEIEGIEFGKKEDSLQVLVHAIRAQQASLHPILLDKRFQAKKKLGFIIDDADDADYAEEDDGDFSGGDDEDEDDDDTEEDDGDFSGGEDDDEETSRGNLESTTAAPVKPVHKFSQAEMDAIHERLHGDRSEEEQNGRKAWLKHLKENVNVPFESGRVQRVLRLYTHLRKKYPLRKMVISSQYLRFLDLVKSALLQQEGIEGLDYNGVMADSQRQANLVTFRSSSTTPSKPLFLSGKAGGEGINIPEASIMIQTEVWWNRNAELQLYSRLLRPGQPYTVIVIRLQALECSIDDCIINIQSKKKTVNTVLMRPLVRPHDEPPKVPDMSFPPQWYVQTSEEEEGDEEDEEDEEDED